MAVMVELPAVVLLRMTEHSPTSLATQVLVAPPTITVTVDATLAFATRTGKLDFTIATEAGENATKLVSGAG